MISFFVREGDKEIHLIDIDNGYPPIVGQTIYFRSTTIGNPEENRRRRYKVEEITISIHAIKKQSTPSNLFDAISQRFDVFLV